MHKMLFDVEMTDGTIHQDVRAILADQIKYSEVRARHKWPAMQNDPLRAMAFIAYAAMTRTGLYDAQKGFDDFTNDVAQLEMDESEETAPFMTGLDGASQS